MAKKAIIIGAGPWYPSQQRTNCLSAQTFNRLFGKKSGDIGGISKTINYKGNRMDIGGHRFFNKSDRVMNWWGTKIMPLQQR